MLTDVSPSVTTSRVPTVLIVEDEARVRRLLCMALEGVAGVLEASDGEQALKILQQRAGRAVDVMLVDHALPTRSGLELLGLTRRRWPWIPVVIMTGYGSEDLAIRAFRGGAMDYLKKPIDISELRRVVQIHAQAGCQPTAREVGGPDTRLAEQAGTTHSGIRRALMFVRERFTEPITLAQVAEEAGMSKFHVCRLFRRQVGVSIREYLHVVRIDRAKHLLADPQLTVTEVAYGAGFNDLSHFDKIFNRIVGVSPSAYRRDIRST